MPRNIEHIVETRQLAAERRKAGLPAWAFTVDISHIWNNDDMDDEAKRRAIPKLIRRTSWYRACGGDGSELERIVEDLEDFADDAEEWNDVWDALYDEADFDRAWINLLGGGR